MSKPASDKTMLTSETKVVATQEPMLKENPDRFVVYPIEHNDIWEKYKQHVACMWTVEEVDLSQDKKDWVSLNDGEKHFITMVLAFFAASDGIVMENLNLNFANEVQWAEVRQFYGFQIAMEGIHAEMYSLLIDTFVKNPAEKKRLFQAVKNFPCIAEKAAWAMTWMDPTLPFAQRLVAFAVVEGIFFSGSFCAIYWLKKRGLMPGLTFSNELISRDEGLHTDFACLLYSKLQVSLKEEVVQQIVREAVEIEKEFITEALPVALIGMNASLMSQYIEFVADRLLTSLGCAKLYHAKNPFEWMEMISLQGKTNFFERRVGEYQKAGVMSKREENHVFTTTADF